MTGHKPGPIIVFNFEYGKDYSGPGYETYRPFMKGEKASLFCFHHSKDVLKEDRATGDPIEADISNFLHPVLYYYTRPPTTSKRLLLPSSSPSLLYTHKFNPLFP